MLDNWFRARRQSHDLAEALRQRGMPLPAARSLYHDLDPAPMAEAFTGWYAQRHGTEPDPEAVGALAEEWMEGTLLETWHAISPHRVAIQLALINDWIPDNPVTVAAKALLPEWVHRPVYPSTSSTVGSLSPQAMFGRHRSARVCEFKANAAIRRRRATGP